MALTQLVIYILASNAAMTVSLYNALDTRTSFLSAGIFLSGGLNLIIMSNWIFSWCIVITRIVQRLLFGRLRFIEVEHIQERFLPKFIAFLISLGYVEEESSFVLAALTIVNLVLSVCHWVLFDRLDSLFQVNDERQLQSLRRCLFNRTTFATTVMCFIDFKFIWYCIKSLRYTSDHVFVIFGFDVALLLLESLFHICKEGINAAEFVFLKRNEGDDFLEKKSFYTKLLELSFVVSRLLVYVFLLVFLRESYPIQFLSDFFLCLFALHKKAKEFIAFIRNSKRLDKVLQDATEQDLEGSDRLCIICREDMSTKGVVLESRLYPKKLICNHIIHLGCLKSWIEVSENCPICRANVFSSENNGALVPANSVIHNEDIIENNVNENSNYNSTRRITSESNGNINSNSHETNNKNFSNSEDYFEDRHNNENVENANEDSKIENENSAFNSHSTQLSEWKVFPVEALSKDYYNIDLNGRKGKIKIKQNEPSSSHRQRKNWRRNIDEALMLKLADRLENFERKISELDKKLDLVISLSKLSATRANNDAEIIDSD